VNLKEAFMDTSSKKFRVTLLDAADGSGDCILPIPDAMMTEMGWKIGDTLAIDKVSDAMVLASKGVEQLDKEVVTLAEEVFGDSSKATSWLFRKHRMLGMSPAEYLNNGNSKTEVLKILRSIMHGGAV
jgi:hypothetical protein